MVAGQGLDWMEICAATEPGFGTCKTEVIYANATTPHVSKPSPSPLEKYSLRGMSAELEKHAVDDVFVLPGIALMGDSTVIYGAPGSSKTLLTLYLLTKSIDAGAIDPDKVFYVNVDDSLRGLTQKLVIAEEFGFHMLAEGHRNFRASDLRNLLFDAITNGQAHGTVVVLDTLKKFTNLMDKTKASAFSTLCRQFAMKGGTMIALAHTNKNPGPDGKPKYGGTSDMVDDADCAYIIDTLDISDPAYKAVVLEKEKSRGNNALTACYRFSQEPGQSYEALLASVEPVDETQLLTLKKAAELKSDAPVIDAIVAAIQEGVNTKMKFADAAAERAGCSRRAALKIIEHYTGSDPSMHRWTFERSKHGAKVYALTPKDTPNA